MPRTLFIGDIHGCYDELVLLYEKMQITGDDLVYTTGDLINKGPFSQKTVQFVREKKISCVLGNHDIKFLKCLDGRDEPTDWFDGVMSQFVDHSEDIDFLRSLPYWIEEEDFLLVHAGLDPTKATLSEQLERDSIARIRLFEGRPWHEYYIGKKIVIYGHWSEQGLRFTHNTRGLDSGCVWGGHLTGFCLETDEIWQLRANHLYAMADHWKNI